MTPPPADSLAPDLTTPEALPLLLTDPAWQTMDWLVHGSSTRVGGESTVYLAGEPAQASGELNLGFTAADERKTVLRNRELLVRAACRGDEGMRLTPLSQVHSAVIHRVSREVPEAGPGDGLITDTPGFLLAIQTADCVPVLLVDPEHRAVGAFHAGWRGTVERIVEQGVDRLRAAFGSAPERMLALIGPAIEACCYTVGAELREAFSQRFDYADALFAGDGDGKLRLDLVEANRRQLLAAGVAASSVGRLGGCTSCHPELYFSHRQAQGHTGRMMSVVGIRG